MIAPPGRDEKRTAEASAALDTLAAGLYAEEAEQALLGACLANRHALESVVDLLTPTQFYFPAHGLIWDAMQAMSAAGIAVDPLTLRRHLATEELLAEIGGAQYISDLAQQIVLSDMVAEHAREIARTAAQRAMLAAVRDALPEIATDSPVSNLGDVAGRLSSALDVGVYASAGLTKQRGMVSLAVAIEELEAHVSAMARPGALDSLCRIGLDDVDRAIGALMSDDFVIIAGRPGMGKTAIMRTIAEANAKRGKNVGIFSAEMSRLQLATLFNTADSGIAAVDLRLGKIAGRSPEFAQANNRLRDLPVYIDDSSGLTVARIRRRVQNAILKKRPFALVMVDYVQLMGDPRHAGARDPNRVQEIAEVSRGLKGIAKDFAIPVIGLAQLSRKVEERQDKRPQLSDLRESGQLEQDADVVAFLFREAYYHGMQQPEETDPAWIAWNERAQQLANRAEIIIAKSRFAKGATTVQVAFDAPRIKFGNLAGRAMSEGYGYGDDDR